MHKYFFNKTKAEVLSDLSRKNLIFKIPKTLFFKVEDWHHKREFVLKQIFYYFKDKKKKRKSLLDPRL